MKRFKSALTFLVTGQLLGCFVLTYGQGSERKLIREGNKLYKEKKYSDAEVSYKKSLNENKNSVPGNYNLGNSYYKEGKYEEAAQQYQSVFSNKDLDDKQKSQAFHNLGNSLLEAKKYPESIEAYKNALKMNPKDNDTRYNLAYAQSMLQQQQQQQQQNKNDKNKDQKNKDQKNQEQKKNEQDQKKDQQAQKEDQKKSGEKKQNISKEDAEKILQALNNDEKNTQKKLIKKEPAKIQIEKAW